MARFVSILVIIYLFLMFAMKEVSYTETGNYKASMKDHIEDMKLKQPEKYTR